MITFGEACKIAYDYYADFGFFGLKAANDLGDKYSFMGNPNIIPYKDTLPNAEIKNASQEFICFSYQADFTPITVSKETGKINGFNLFFPDNIKLLENSIEMNIPKEFK